MNNLKKILTKSLLSFLLLLIACEDNKYEKVVFEISKTNNQPSKQSEIRFGMASILSPSAIGIGLVDLSYYLTEQIGEKVYPLRGKDYQEINRLIFLDEIDVAFVCTGAFSDKNLDEKCDILVVSLLDGKSEYHSLIITTNEDISKIDDFRMKSFAFTDPLSLSGFIYPLASLSKKNLLTKNFFKSSTFSLAHDESIKLVADGMVDGAAVDSQVFKFFKQKFPSKSAKIKVVEVSPPFPSPPIIVRKDLNPNLKQNLLKALLKLNKTEDGRAILQEIGVDGFALPDEKYFQSLKETKNLLRRSKSYGNIFP